jgi:hypothetical protein
MAKLRIPFIEAINEPRLFKDHFWGNKAKGWPGLSFPQQAALMATYGLELSDEKDERGFSRLQYFWASQGYGTYDDLGFLTGVEIPGPYVPKEYRELWMIAGVRSGKSSIADTATAYEAVCGGHEEFLKKGTRAFSFQVAQDLKSARKSITTIKSVLDMVPMLTTPYMGPGAIKGKSRMGEPLAERIDLWNGMSIVTMPPAVKTVRGYDSPCAVLDEIGVWPTEEGSANADYDVYDQVMSRQGQFEFPKIFGLSSPWIMSGILYDRAIAGTDGRNIICADCEVKPSAMRPVPCEMCIDSREEFADKLVYKLPTGAFNNPVLKTSWLKAKKAVSPQNFRRECLAEFQPSTQSFLDQQYVDECVDRGISEREVITRDPRAKSFVPIYVAALDSGFKHDAFAFGIGHADEHGKVVIDLVRQFKPVAGQPNNPTEVLKAITPLMQKYGCISALADQNEFYSLSDLAAQQGWFIENLPFSTESKLGIFGNLQTLVNLRKIRLLDRQDVLHELKALQRTISSSGNIKIGAPAGLHDDLAVIIALLASRAVLLNPTVMEPKKDESYQDLIDRQIARKHKALKLEGSW